MAPVRDRVQKLVRIRAGELHPHPQNWRRHPDRQGVEFGLTPASRSRIKAGPTPQETAGLQEIEEDLFGPRGDYRPR